ncbi:MAG TPA: MBL fold metallo-hydrolase [Blastocatellia bacterium]|nr:MBL fold metallo-hydrolase [Blastocatellia bacterium]
MATIQFIGAAGTVTGSKFVLEAAGSRVMVDCGLFQGLKELRLRNWEPLPVSPASLNAVILTHAHIDHSGYLPRLVRDGFHGPVYATTGTADLLSVMLPDSARLQEEDADYANRHHFSKHHPALPLYNEADARRALKLVRGVAYKEEIRLGKFLRASFVPAGHILGSGFVQVEVSEPDAPNFTILFSGDLGRYDEPILHDPTPVPEADYLLVESTYGNRLHDKTDPKDRLAEIVNETAERGGRVIIPAFAIGRTQLLLYYLRELEDEGRIPVLPVIVDSPMAASATRFYARHKEDHDLEMQRLSEGGRNALTTRNFQLVSGRSNSKALNALTGPAIIISASGMATGGRVLHHLERSLPDPASTVVLVGYQAEGTRGRRLQNGEREIRIHGEMIPVRAKIEVMGSLSAHADANEIMRWLREFKRPPKLTFIVHGEPEGSAALRERITNELGWQVMIPAYQETVELS